MTPTAKKEYQVMKNPKSDGAMTTRQKKRPPIVHCFFGHLLKNSCGLAVYLPDKSEVGAGVNC